MLKGLQQDNIYLDKGCIERGTLEVKCLTKEHSAMARLGLEPRPLDLEFCAEHQSFACPKPKNCCG